MNTAETDPVIEAMCRTRFTTFSYNEAYKENCRGLSFVKPISVHTIYPNLPPQLSKFIDSTADCFNTSGGCSFFPLILFFYDKSPQTFPWEYLEEKYHWYAPIFFQEFRRGIAARKPTPVFQLNDLNLYTVDRTLGKVAPNRAIDLFNSLSPNQALLMAIYINYPELHGYDFHWVHLKEIDLVTDTALIVGDITHLNTDLSERWLGRAEYDWAARIRLSSLLTASEGAYGQVSTLPYAQYLLSPTRKSEGLSSNCLRITLNPPPKPI